MSEVTGLSKLTQQQTTICSKFERKILRMETFQSASCKKSSILELESHTVTLEVAKHSPKQKNKNATSGQKV